VELGRLRARSRSSRSEHLHVRGAGGASSLSCSHGARLLGGGVEDCQGE
jgi:hypothetical protein